MIKLTKEGEKRIPVCARLPLETHADFKSSAAKRGKKMQDVVEELITEWLKANTNPRKAR